MTTSEKELLFVEERKREILNLIHLKKKVLVPDLVEQFGVSAATIRHDLRELEEKGLLKKTHGGAMRIDLPNVGYEKESDSKGEIQNSQKQAIARKALEFIEPNDIILLDAGTTSMEIAKILDAKMNLTVVVNDVEIARCLERKDGVHIILIGGTLRKKFHCTVGPLATKLLSELNVDKAFLATNGLSVLRGCTTPDINQAEIKQLMASISSQVIILSDSSKMNIESFVQFAALSDIDLLITDNGIEPTLLNELTKFGIEVIIA